MAAKLYKVAGLRWHHKPKAKKYFRQMTSRWLRRQWKQYERAVNKVAYRGYAD